MIFIFNWEVPILKKEWLQALPLKEILDVQPVGGGDVNQAFRLRTATGNFFLLVQPQTTASFYAAEIAGLEDFKKAGILAPRVIAHGEIQGDAYLILNYLEQGSGSQAELGQLVAKLHMQHSPNGKFGYALPYSGSSITLDNTWTDSWVELFVEKRLDVLATAVADKGLWDQRAIARYKQVRPQIVQLLQNHPSQPVLLHGDLWSGNYLFLADGRPALIDPAAFYGDREFDLGVTTVFGGFSEQFYRAYAKLLPFAQGYEKRLDLYRLYYLLIHLNKFGSTYAASVQRVVQQIANY
ncbi:fructosamine Ketosamine-3-kinase [Liquorilactobacillus satsumensis DSM 16230 = JCM 12392]|uniref:Fructosamine Ketosamine-3-kinase n=1 Tax=Liquorilactobacillus satsumensis DSM 16230 = JCM 12392 TaxID=1423801 RepID=A0A0R1V3Y7_9LACO|nr:fructosamine Ketosamine-3-kinase [Liquorilactobacillus satsumensis DSM 16230 = JCM 12392]